MYECFACIYVCTPCECLTDTLVLELQQVVSHHVSAGNQPCSHLFRPWNHIFGLGDWWEREKHY